MGIMVDSRGLEGDVIFWNQNFFHVKCNRKDLGGQDLISFFRTNDGTRLCVFDTTKCKIIYNSTNFARNPVAILD